MSKLVLAKTQKDGIFTVISDSRTGRKFAKGIQISELTYVERKYKGMSDNLRSFVGETSFGSLIFGNFHITNTIVSE